LGKSKCFHDKDGRACTACGKYKPWSEYYNSKHGLNGHRSKCKSCFSLRNRSNKISDHVPVAPSEVEQKNRSSFLRVCAKCEYLEECRARVRVGRRVMCERPDKLDLEREKDLAGIEWNNP